MAGWCHIPHRDNQAWLFHLSPDWSRYHNHGPGRQSHNNRNIECKDNHEPIHNRKRYSQSHSRRNRRVSHYEDNHYQKVSPWWWCYRETMKKRSWKLEGCRVVGGCRTTTRRWLFFVPNKWRDTDSWLRNLAHSRFWFVMSDVCRMTLGVD